MCAVTTPYEVVLKHAETIPDQTALTFGDARSVVYPVPDPIWVQEVGAVVVPRVPSVRVEDLWRWCEQRLAGYKVPRYIDLRLELPTTATGRVNKAQLRGTPLTSTTRDRRAAPTVPDDAGA